ncbi:PREDICTED: DNA-directed RNA polymerase III subunit RPC7-like isoform X1 [Dinoponera quadriceps]|uniref:DNA-directed RNA polymerase III subunit RPC7-like isoform X1 n=1 Tax=Dinoponera quadriceps TaxID=609295 RepID=A0A6P3XS94_DINQU|nr:PREDICTED: DNA-directed RNA polymerase III subunit RPC7-like isoform X1 [Dinoponera quadriceps]
MAGRGRGKPTMSFATEQLGVTKGELPAQVLQPPLAYPISDLHISSFESTNEIDYLVELKRDFAEYMRDSQNHVMPDVPKKDIERYSDHYQDTLTANLEQESKHDWSRMPTELTPSLKRKAANSPKVRKAKKIKLETKRKRRRIEDENEENKQADKVEQQKDTKQAQGALEKEIKEEEEDEEENSEEEIEQYEVDEEMDDGTDYVNNYFDNGEAFDDEDDNLEDGPIY